MKDIETLEVATIVEILRYRADRQPEQIGYTFLVDGESEEIKLSYRELDFLARAIAAHLQSLASPGERALLLYPPGLEYIIVFFACLYAGIVAVPAYPPRPNRSLSRLQAIIASSQAKLALTNESILSNLKRRKADAPELDTLTWLATDSIAENIASRWQEPSLDGNSLAFLQYTSGSTAAPKGVSIAHSNLLHNLKSIYRCFQHSANSLGVIWLPPYHDMGLIGGVLQPLYGGFPVILMSPLMFLQNPLRWLQGISRYRGTTSGGPNFAYDFCVRKITPEQLSTLDLSSWEVAFNGAEPINSETMESFASKFQPSGFRREAFYPCYGMAEATLIVSGGLKTAKPVLKTFRGDALEQNRAIAVDTNEDGARTLASCGQSLPDQSIAIAHPETEKPLPDGEVGEIWVSGPSVARGYWQNPEETERTFRAYLGGDRQMVSANFDRLQPLAFMRTGDLGFLSDGELFVTGRLKDLIVINGRNHYPQDIERTVEECHPLIEPSSTAAFSVDVSGEEGLVVVAEVERRYRRQLGGMRNKQGPSESSPSLVVEEVIQSIRRSVSQNHDLQIYAALLLKPGSIPKTSSGKIQRLACRAGFLAGTLEVVAN